MNHPTSQTTSRPVSQTASQEKTDLIFVTGFGDKGVADVLDTLQAEYHWNFRRTAIIPGAPWYRALQSRKKTVSRVCGKIEKLGHKNNIILIGGSYGALLALVAACRRNFKNVLGLILIDGPLDQAVTVVPVKLSHRLYFRHYAGREDLAKEFPRFREKRRRNDESELNEILSKIVTLGTEKDSIVPPLSKKLTDVNHIPLPYKGHRLDTKPVAEILDGILKRIFGTGGSGGTGDETDDDETDSTH